MKRDRGPSGGRLLLFFWFIFFSADIGIESHAAEASGSASASVLASVSVSGTIVDSVIVDLRSVSDMNDALPGRLVISIANAGMPAGTSSGDTRFVRLTLANLIKLSDSKGMLSGAIASAVSVTSTSAAGPVIVTVAYN